MIRMYLYIDELGLERHNSNALAMELRLSQVSYTNPLICDWCMVHVKLSM